MESPYTKDELQGVRPGPGDVDWQELGCGLLRNGDGRTDEEHGIEGAIEQAREKIDEEHLTDAELRALAHEVVDEVFEDDEDVDIALARERNKQLSEL